MDMFPNAGAGAAAVPPSDVGQMIDLNDQIEKSGCKSDADEQLIIHLAFKEVVRIKSIELTEFNEGRDPESNPSKIHLYVNRDNLGFEDAEEVDPTQTLHLTTEDMKKPIALKFVKYQRVNSLTIFIEDNQGGEVSALGGLKLVGRPVASTNMNDFKKKPDQV